MDNDFRTMMDIIFIQPSRHYTSRSRGLRKSLSDTSWEYSVKGLGRLYPKISRHKLKLTATTKCPKLRFLMPEISNFSDFFKKRKINEISY